jgi:hypothetical protein
MKDVVRFGFRGSTGIAARAEQDGLHPHPPRSLGVAKPVISDVLQAQSGHSDRL